MNINTGLITLKDAPNNLHDLVVEGRRQSQILLKQNALLVAQVLVESIDHQHSVNITSKKEFDAYSKLIGAESFCPQNCVVISIVNLPRNGPNYTIGFCDQQRKSILNVSFILKPDLYSVEDKVKMRHLLQDLTVEKGLTLIYNLKKHTLHPVSFIDLLPTWVDSSQ